MEPKVYDLDDAAETHALVTALAAHLDATLGPLPAVPQAELDDERRAKDKARTQDRKAARKAKHEARNA
jgi:hypothetical protein